MCDMVKTSLLDYVFMNSILCASLAYFFNIKCSSIHVVSSLCIWNDTLHQNRPFSWKPSINTTFGTKISYYQDCDTLLCNQMWKRGSSILWPYLEFKPQESRAWKVSSEMFLIYDWGEPAVSYRWTGWVWEITSWSSRLQGKYWSF